MPMLLNLWQPPTHILSTQTWIRLVGVLHHSLVVSGDVLIWLSNPDGGGGGRVGGGLY